MPTALHLTRSGAPDIVVTLTPSKITDGAGKAVLTIGGTVPVSSSTPAGRYSGTYTVIAAYN